MNDHTTRESYEEQNARRGRERLQIIEKRASLSRQIAEALGATVEGTQPSGDDDLFTLVLDGRRFQLHYYHQERVSVSGAWPRARNLDGIGEYQSPQSLGAIPYDTNPPEITVATTRGAATIAKTIQQRFLPAFTPIYDKCAELVQQREEGGKQAWAGACELVQRLGGNVAGFWTPKTHGQQVTVHLRGYTVTLSGGYRVGVGCRIERCLDGLTVDQVARILLIVSENDK